MSGALCLRAFLLDRNQKVFLREELTEQELDSACHQALQPVVSRPGVHDNLLQSWHQEIVHDVIDDSARACYILIDRLFLPFAGRWKHTNSIDESPHMAWKHQVVVLQMKEWNVSGGHRRKRQDQRWSIWGCSVQTLCSHSGSQPFNPPPRRSFELFRGFGAFFMAAVWLKEMSVVSIPWLRGELKPQLWSTRTAMIKCVNSWGKSGMFSIISAVGYLIPPEWPGIMHRHVKIMHRHVKI